MRYLPVHWSEGMFLRPQHFQAAERSWSELAATSQQWDNPYNYGLHGLTISREALANYHLQITSCQARMPEGTLIELGGGSEPDRLNLKEAFEKTPQVMVYLAVPKMVLGRRNVGQAGEPGEHRFVEREVEVPDESRGGNDQVIQVRDLNVRLVLSTQERSGYEVLPIARIRRTGHAEATPELDEDYIPPVLSLDAWPPLGVDIVRWIYDFIGRNIEILSQRMSERGVTLATQDPGDLEDLLRLMVLNRAYSSLGCMAFAAGVHPLVAYQELCRIVGELSIFDESRRSKGVPRYDHDDLATIFKWARDEIKRLVAVSKREWEMRHFVGTEHGMEVGIDPKWLESAWSWYVGVKGEHLAEQEIKDLLRPGKLDWKMGSAQQVEFLFRDRKPGVRLTPLDQPPRTLPTRKGWVYYELAKDPDNTAWRDVRDTNTLAVRFKRELIANLGSLKGQTRLEVHAAGRRTVMEFALFAVPPQPT